jgi:hypothetical protein
MPRPHQEKQRMKNLTFTLQLNIFLFLEDSEGIFGMSVKFQRQLAGVTFFSRILVLRIQLNHGAQVIQEN